MKFNTTTDVTEAMELLPVNIGGHRQYSILFKKAIIEYLEFNPITQVNLCDLTGLNSKSLNTWKNQYMDGLYELDAVVAVSPRAKSSNHLILQKLKGELRTLTTKLDLVEQCEKMGITVNIDSIQGANINLN